MYFVLQKEDLYAKSLKTNCFKAFCFL